MTDEPLPLPDGRPANAHECFFPQPRPLTAEEREAREELERRLAYEGTDTSPYARGDYDWMGRRGE